MRRSIIHYTAFVLAGPGVVGLIVTLILAVGLIAFFVNQSQGAPPNEEMDWLQGMAGVSLVATCFLFSMTLFFFSCLLWGMELLIERAEKRDRLLNEQTSVLFQLQRLLTPHEST